MNMKTYLPTLLIFFLLLVDKPVSISFPKFATQFLKKAPQELGGIAVDAGLTYIMNKPNNPPPRQPLPSAQPQVIQGLSAVKSYLYNYGYIQSQSYPPSFTDTMDQGTQLAIKNYQSVFNLQTTSFPDIPTVQKMLQARCSVPDLNLRYTLNDPNREVSWPKGNNWSPDPKSLTYGFDPLIINNDVNNVMIVFKESLLSWSKATGVSFTETYFEDAQIKVMFYNLFNDQSRMEVVASTIIVRQPQSGNDYNVGFVILENGKGANLQDVVMHQIGHILGLEHSDDKESIMHPVFNIQQQAKLLSDSDIHQINRLSSGQSPGDGGGNLISDKYQPVGSGGVVSNNYSPAGSGSGSGGGERVGSSWGLLVAALSIGFSCMALY